MHEYKLTLSENQALVLGSLFNRFDETDKLEFAHPAEYLALMNLAGQIDRTTPSFFSSDYESLLENARNQIAEGFEGEVPGMGPQV